MRTTGQWLAAAGAIGAVFALLMDVSVSTDYGRVNNIGLMQQQQNYILISGIAFIAGIIMIAMGQMDNRQPTHKPLTSEEELASEDLNVIQMDDTFYFEGEPYPSRRAAVEAAAAAKARKEASS